MATVRGTGFDDNSTVNNGALRPRLIGTVDSDTMDGLAGNDRLEALGGDDSLDGGTGSDTLDGGRGSDTFFVDSSGDVVIEDADQGSDTIFSQVSLTLPANVEHLTLTTGIDGAFSPFAGTGNALDNTIRGNDRGNSLSAHDGSDALFGREGNDTLNGGNGTDLLEGGSGADRMIGGNDNDLYSVDTFEEFFRDQVIELSNEGIDTVHLFDADVTFTLPDNVENILLLNPVVGANGNELDNKMNGNELNNKLSGFAGNDTLISGEGDDLLIGGQHNDSLSGGEGRDTLNGASNTGGSGVGRNEIDLLTGGSEGDTFVLGDANTVFYLGAGGRAIIKDFSRSFGGSLSDKIQVHGSLSDYNLSYGNTIGDSALETNIFYKGDLIGVTQDFSLVLSTDFVSV